MLLVVTGSSCSGKSTAARWCAGVDGLDVHDQDEDGVPSHADTAWRQRSLERWTRRAAGSGRDLLLTTQAPLGELLAVPSATAVDLAVCLVDVADRDRWIRLARRDPGLWSDEQRRAFVGWARWHRAHADDPRERPEVITHEAWPAMRWDRWSSWDASDPRWHVDTVDTTGRTPHESGAELCRWVAGVRAARDAGTLPLSVSARSSPQDPVDARGDRRRRQGR